jgi:hypothetical protein
MVLLSLVKASVIHTVGSRNVRPAILYLLSKV